MDATEEMARELTVLIGLLNDRAVELEGISGPVTLERFWAWSEFVNAAEKAGDLFKHLASLRYESWITGRPVKISQAA